MNKILETYNLLLQFYGFQAWWPVTDPNKIKPEYKPRKKLTKRQKLEIILGAIMTQNTAWKNVEKAIINLNKNKLLSTEKLRALPENKLAELIKPSGYYNQKAKKIKAMIRFLDLKKPVTRENLLSVWGVGPETADSILLYAYEQPFFVIDAYTKRIFSRLGFCKEKAGYDELQELFHNNLEKNVNVFKEYHALLVEHGKRYCRKKPVCKKCVLKKECAYVKKFQKFIKSIIKDKC